MSNVSEEGDDEYAELTEKGERLLAGKDVTLEPSQELYIPEAKLNSNVKRMAWLLFMEVWKAELTMDNAEGWKTWTKEESALVHNGCVEMAKVVWHEQEKGYEQD